jgi:hypothetical protein
MMIRWPTLDPEGERLARKLPPFTIPWQPGVEVRHRRKSFKSWRAEGQENLWTRGSCTRACGRFFCCTVMITVFLIISILLSLALVRSRPSVPALIITS